MASNAAENDYGNGRSPAKPFRSTGNDVNDFTEKPQTQDGYVSGGFIVASREFIDQYLTPSATCVLETDGLSPVAQAGQMSVYRHNGFWMPMDNSLEYNALNALWARDEAPWKIW